MRITSIFLILFISSICSKNLLKRCGSTPSVVKQCYVKYDEVDITYSSIGSDSASDIVNLLDNDLNSGNKQGWSPDSSASAWLQITLKAPVLIHEIDLVLNISQNSNVTYTTEIQVVGQNDVIQAIKTSSLTNGQMISIPVNQVVKSFKITTTYSEISVAWGRVLFKKC